MNHFQGKRILLGVCGGVSAFKAVELLRMLTKAGATVDVVMTPHATRFVGVASMKGLSGRPVLLDLYDLPGEVTGEAAVMPHLAYAEGIDLALVVPATANTLAKMACGLADNALVTTLLSVTAPIVVAPAMDTEMWLSKATQQNVATLQERGVHFVGPVEGELARRNVGHGRLSEPEEIFAYAEGLLAAASHRPLAGRRILVTAGGTREPIDPVRYIGNRSSGKMGFAVAEAARHAGAHVTLVYAPSAVKPPSGCELVAIETAAQMHDEVLARFGNCDALVMAAAVADFRVEAFSPIKIKKEKSSDGRLQLTLVQNPDIAAECGRIKRDGQVIVIFAAETGDDAADLARQKLIAKRADLVVANDVSRPGSGFEVDTNEVTLIDAAGAVETLPLMTKREVGRHVVDAVARLLGE